MTDRIVRGANVAQVPMPAVDDSHPTPIGDRRGQKTGGGLTPAGPPLFESPSCNYIHRQMRKYHAIEGVPALSALVSRAAVRKRTQRRIDGKLASGILITATRHV